MERLLEVDYEKIFSPSTMASLKGKSGQSLRQMIGDKTLMQTMMRSTTLISEIIAAEEDYRDELEMELFRSSFSFSYIFYYIYLIFFILKLWCDWVNISTIL